MATKLTELPAEVAAVERHARSQVGILPTSGQPDPIIEGVELRSWIREFSESGELAVPIRDVEATDSDLVGQVVIVR